MAGRPYDEGELQAIRDGHAAGKHPGEIAAALPGRSTNAVRQKGEDMGLVWGVRVDIRDNAEPEVPRPTGAVRKEISGDKVALEIDGTPYSDPEELMRLHGFDPDLWEIERAIVNHYPLGTVTRKVEKDEHGGKVETATPDVRMMFQVKLWLRMCKPAVRLVALKESILADLRDHAPVYPSYSTPSIRDPAERHLLELCVFDPHFGKYAWREESGEDYDLKIAGERFLWAVEELLRRAHGFPLERIVIPVGNDALHADNAQNTTTGGTPQDVDSRWFKVFRTARLLYTHAIDRCLTIAPVDVVVVPGNHDRQSALALGEVLDAHYGRTERVHVNGGPRLRKYYEYGSNMILYTHGSEERPNNLPLLMATEEPQMWARTKYREAHTGHLHKKRETQFVGVDEHNGVRVRILGSLAGTDAWHHSRGFTQNWKAAEAFIWSRDGGLVGNVSANLPDELPAAA